MKISVKQIINDWNNSFFWSVVNGLKSRLRSTDKSIFRWRTQATALDKKIQKAVCSRRPQRRQILGEEEKEQPSRQEIQRCPAHEGESDRLEGWLPGKRGEIIILHNHHTTHRNHSSLLNRLAQKRANRFGPKFLCVEFISWVTYIPNFKYFDRTVQKISWS